jgi:hypothetical protein
LWGQDALRLQQKVCFVDCFAIWVTRAGAVAFVNVPAPKGENKVLDRYGDTPFRSETGFAPIRSNMAVAIKDVLIQSTFVSADEARSHATRARADSAWQHCDAQQFSEKTFTIVPCMAPRCGIPHTSCRGFSE